jgi:pimeloyl-ACP methyl ester carboxylesterase
MRDLPWQTLGVLLLSAASTQPGLAQDDDAPLVTELVYASPSRLVEVDPGRRINLYCLGAGSPTVVFDSGLGGGTPAWAPIQAKIAKATRACSYDRAGINFSDPSPRASSSVNIVDDLHRTLAAAGVAPPYVVVGHSYGGLNVRLFATTYPSEVVGMVLVDPMHEDQRETYRLLDPKKSTFEEWDKQDQPTMERLAKCEAAAVAGFVAGTEIYSTCHIGQPDSLFGPEINVAYEKLKLLPGHWHALRSETENVFRASSDQVRTSNRDLGSLPLIVLTRSPAPKKDTESQTERDRRNQVWVDMHDQIAALSKRGVNRIVPDSSHAIQFDQPQAVIDSILEVVRTSAAGGDRPERQN